MLENDGFTGLVGTTVGRWDRLHPVGRLSQSSWLFSRRAIVPIVLAVWLFAQACSPPALRLLLADQAQASGSRLALSESSVEAYLKKLPLILGWFDSSERREGFCAV